MSEKREFDTAVSVSPWNAKTYRFDQETVYRDADVRQLDRHGVFPGAQFQLRLPSIDEETGTETDVDGDRSFKRDYLYATEVYVIGRGSITYKGFESEEKDSGRGAYPTGNFRLVEWHVYPYAWIVESEREAAKDAKLASTLTERERQVIVGIRRYELDAEARRKEAIGSLNTWVEFPKESEDAEGYLSVLLPNGIEATFEEVTAIKVGGEPAVMVSHEDKTDFRRSGSVVHRDVSLLTKAEHVADALIAEEDA